MHSSGLKYQEATCSLCTTSGAAALILLQKYWCLVLENCPGLALGCLVAQLCLTLCDSMDCCPPGSSLWDYPSKSTGVGCHFLLQGIFLTQGLNLWLLHWQVDSLPLSHLGNPAVDVRSKIWLEGFWRQKMKFWSLFSAVGLKFVTEGLRRVDQ